jgi:hypothetical protein
MASQSRAGRGFHSSGSLLTRPTSPVRFLHVQPQARCHGIPLRAGPFRVNVSTSPNWLTDPSDLGLLSSAHSLTGGFQGSGFISPTLSLEPPRGEHLPLGADDGSNGVPYFCFLCNRDVPLEISTVFVAIISRVESALLCPLYKCRWSFSCCTPLACPLNSPLIGLAVKPWAHQDVALRCLRGKVGVFPWAWRPLFWPDFGRPFLPIVLWSPSTQGLRHKWVPHLFLFPSGVRGELRRLSHGVGCHRGRSRATAGVACRGRWSCHK